MAGLSGLTPFRDLKSHRLEDVRGDLVAAMTLAFMAVPQGIAYAMIAGMPPAMGLYAAAIPAIIGAFFRSSRHVNIGPTNSVSILIGSALIVSVHPDPALVGVTLAFLVGVLQIGAGLLGLGIGTFSAVFVTNITGAGILIGVGQLPNLTSTHGGNGNVLARVEIWLSGIGNFNPWALAMAVGTAALILILRRIHRRIPGPIIALMGATFISVIFELHEVGLQRIVDLNPIPSSLPPLTMPSFGLLAEIFPLALAVAVLSLVEASSVGRSIAAMSGQKLHSGADFVGLGLANLSSSFCGGYAVSGSLSRSALNYSTGGKSRLSGVYGGLLILGVLLVLGPLVNETPIAALAGLLMIVAWDLVDVTKIRQTLAGSWGDRAAFLTTTLGTWALPLDKAIYLGVGVSFVFLLRQFQVLKIEELGKDDHQKWTPSALGKPAPLGLKRCETVRVFQISGRLFFGAEGSLREKLSPLVQPGKALVIHLSRASGMDVTIAQYFHDFASGTRRNGGSLVFSGVSQTTYDMWQRVGLVEHIGESNIIRGVGEWESQAGDALLRAWEGLEPSSCSTCTGVCPCQPPSQPPTNADVIAFPRRT